MLLKSEISNLQSIPPASHPGEKGLGNSETHGNTSGSDPPVPGHGVDPEKDFAPGVVGTND
jgi:hypothetical protein